MATMHDVALRAGVSPKTVSRVLNDHDSVTARTRERVRAAMKALDYHPNAVARHLRSNTAPSMGVLMGEMTKEGTLVRTAGLRPTREGVQIGRAHV